MKTQRKAVLALVALAAMHLSTNALAAKEQCLVYDSGTKKIELKLCDAPERATPKLTEQTAAAEVGKACAVPDPTVAGALVPLASPPVAAAAASLVSSTSELRASLALAGDAPASPLYEETAQRASGSTPPSAELPPSAEASRPTAAPARMPSAYEEPSAQSRVNAMRERSSAWQQPDMFKRTARVEVAWSLFECLIVLALIFTIGSLAVVWSDEKDRRPAVRPRLPRPVRVSEPPSAQADGYKRPVPTLSVPARKKYGLGDRPPAGSPPGPLARLVGNPRTPSKA